MRCLGKTYWRRRRDRLIKEHVVEQGAVLDIGCGWRAYSKSAIRLDIDLKCNPHVVADIQKGACFPDRHYDTVLMFDVLEHLEYPHRAMEEVKRIIKPGGILFITVPFCYPRHGEEYYRFSELALKKMLSGFEVEIIPVIKSKVWNLVWNYFLHDPIVEGYFVKAKARPR